MNAGIWIHRWRPPWSVSRCAIWRCGGSRAMSLNTASPQATGSMPSLSGTPLDMLIGDWLYSEIFEVDRPFGIMERHTAGFQHQFVHRLYCSFSFVLKADELVERIWTGQSRC